MGTKRKGRDERMDGPMGYSTKVSSSICCLPGKTCWSGTGWH